MNSKQVHKYVQRFLEATECSILEKSPAHFTVKLSPAADRELTNRPFYWSFVDRTGSEPETMTYLFVTDKEKYEENLTSPAPAPAQAANAVDAALNRSFGFVNNNLANAVRTPREDLYFGSRKLEQLFGAAKTSGSYVNLFQEPERRSSTPFQSTPYTAWLGVNMRVEFACDRKREEIHSYGVSLATGLVVENFYDRLKNLKLTPRLPSNIHLTRNGLSYAKALGVIETSLERKLKNYDYAWAEDAAARLEEELDRIRHYYDPMIKHAEDDTKAAIEEQFNQRQTEIRWQYEPRVTASAINCGIFHLEGIE
ncbi:YqhG family protein [Paenibacillus glycanilyticus]|uniref:YqhG family protein n=1 Tax=Paenibacillus glycanilyticus TaxID=126569 RepID=UPI002040495F|nr:YqhG family protein [Paenibacillus glycanilyticus]MCM3626542.1 YqhG family protein [Paenibacillus glycanilyticus]